MRLWLPGKLIWDWIDLASMWPALFSGVCVCISKLAILLNDVFPTGIIYLHSLQITVVSSVFFCARAGDGQRARFPPSQNLVPAQHYAHSGSAHQHAPPLQLPVTL